MFNFVSLRLIFFFFILLFIFGDGETHYIAERCARLLFWANIEHHHLETDTGQSEIDASDCGEKKTRTQQNITTNKRDEKIKTNYV